jgi:hypothetical protein
MNKKGGALFPIETRQLKLDYTRMMSRVDAPSKRLANFHLPEPNWYKQIGLLVGIFASRSRTTPTGHLWRSASRKRLHSIGLIIKAQIYEYCRSHTFPTGWAALQATGEGSKVVPRRRYCWRPSFLGPQRTLAFPSQSMHRTTESNRFDWYRGLFPIENSPK